MAQEADAFNSSRDRAHEKWGHGLLGGESGPSGLAGVAEV